MINCIPNAECSCNSISQYSLFGSTLSSTIQSSINPSMQPEINFPGSSKNPSTSEQGLMITKNKYMDVTDNWTASTSGISLYIWLYYKQGGIGIFAQIGLKNNNKNSKLVTLYGQNITWKIEALYSYTYQYYYIKIGSKNIQVSRIKYGWNLIAVELDGNNLIGSNCQYTSCSLSSSQDISNDSGNISNKDQFYIGCKSCTDSSISYRIYSVQTFEDISQSCILDPKAYSLTNNIYPCGDRIVEPYESCDDGNFNDSDGCDKNCHLESSFTCDDIPDACGSCGNSQRSSSEECDDGNKNGGDGCSSFCTIEDGWNCSGGDPLSKDICNENCGDGIRLNTRQNYCDDGNNADGDGCSSACSQEQGWTCTGGSATDSDTCTEKCGDGVRFNKDSNYCDDGNNVDGDGCSSLCSVESNWKCSRESSDQKDTCTKAVNQEKLAMGQAISGAAGGASLVFSLCNLSTPTGLWMTMNQFQLILLLLLTKSNIPKSIIDYLSGLKATTCSFNFIPFKEIPGLRGLVEYFDSNYIQKELSYFGILSGSSIANNFSLFCILIIVASIHSAFLLINRLLKRKVRTIIKCVKCLEKLYQLFTFSVYIRILLESSQFLMLSSFSELHAWNTSSTSKIISLIFSAILSWACVGFILLTLINWAKLKDVQSLDNYIPLKELLGGQRHSRCSRLYSTVLLTRRAIFVILLIFGSSLNNISLVVPMIIIQLIYMLYLVIVRPFKLVKDNLIEITNECFYCLLLCLLSYYNTENRWIAVIENIYFLLIVLNSAVIISIMMIAFCVTAITKCRSRCRKDQIQPKEENKQLEVIEHDIRDFSSFRVSNDIPSNSKQRDESDIAFREEVKSEDRTDLKSPQRIPTTAELYWQNYNPIDGGRSKIQNRNLLKE